MTARAPRPPPLSIQLPHQWHPRPYQMNAWGALERGCKRVVCVWHRRAGKDAIAWNWTIPQTFERKGAYWHALPTYAQGRKIIWDGMMSTGRSFLDHIPEDLIERIRNDEMKIWLRNGSTIQVVGADQPDLLVGTNPVGVTLSEYSIQNPSFWDFVRPILAENGGWALFLFTPRGRNHGYRIFQAAKQNPSWFAELLTVEDTGAIPLSAIQEDRDSGMSEAMVQQEYYCSFDSALVGSYYGEILSKLEKEGRIGKVPHESSLPVHTAWDLGSTNFTTVWFQQQVHAERRIIDFYMHFGVSLEHYAKILQEKPYTYGRHYFPHDVAVTELQTGKSRISVLRNLGIRPTTIPRGPLEDGISATMQYLQGCWFDKEKCEVGLQGLREYVKLEKPGEQGPNGEPFYSEQPKHNWASDVADSFRTLAIGDRGRGLRSQGSNDPNRPRRSLAPKIGIV